MLRIVCVSALAGADENVVASRNKKGVWDEHQTLKLRSAAITPWLEVPGGESFLCVREGQELVSKTRRQRRIQRIHAADARTLGRSGARALTRNMRRFEGLLRCHPPDSCEDPLQTLSLHRK